MTDLAIETHGLTKVFGERAVVDGLDLAVPSGSVFGFLGPNGSGKTTTVRMLLGLASATSGATRLLGQDMPNNTDVVLRNVGSLVEGPAFYPFLTGRQNLERMELLGRKRSRPEPKADIDLALARVRMTHSANKRFRAYSLGMRQRLALAAALMRPRQLLILDEPTNGLDPQGTREVRTLIRQLNDDGTTVFLSSHLLNEIDQVCTHAAVLSAGKTVAQGPIEELRRARRKILHLQTPDVELARATAEAFHGVSLLPANHDRPNGIDIELQDAQAEQLVVAFVNANVRVQLLTEVGSSLEDAFVALTGEGFDVAE